MQLAHTPFVLIVLDGWGYTENTVYNAIHSANKPTWDRLWREYPHTLIGASGTDVGLPAQQMGNSEVGHMSTAWTARTYLNPSKYANLDAIFIGKRSLGTRVKFLTIVGRKSITLTNFRKTVLHLAGISGILKPSVRMKDIPPMWSKNTILSSPSIVSQSQEL